MRIPTIVVVAMAVMVLFTADAHAHIETRSSNAPIGPLVPGTQYSVDLTGYIHCAVMGPHPNATVEYYEGQVLTVGMTAPSDDAGDPLPWLNGSTADKTLSMSDCGSEGADVGTPGPKIVIAETITFTVTQQAPAFTQFNFQPGAFGESNQGGNFTAEIAYVPAFTAPTALTFEAIEGGATATIPLTMQANADSVFTFEVVSLTFDGGDAPEGAMAHIQDTLQVATGIFAESGVTVTSVDLHFGAGGEGHSGHMDGMDDHHDDMAGNDMGHAHWETAQAIVSITLAAEGDSTQVSEPWLVTMTFTNPDAESMPHDDEDSAFLPGFGLVGVVAALIALMALRRRH